MRLDTSQQLRLQQKLILAPRMIQSMEILQLPVMELKERIDQELQENPVLEQREDSPDDELAPVADEDRVNPDAPSDLERELIVNDDNSNQLDFDRLDALTTDWADHFNEDYRPSRNGIDEESDRKHDAMQNMPSRPQSLDEYLLNQLCFLDIPPHLEDFVRYLISNLDENGFLRSSLEELVAGYGQPIDLADAEEALHWLQKLEPPGMGARDLRECFLLQLTEDTPHREVLRVLIENHLEDIWNNRLPVIQRKTGFDLNVIKAAIETLKHFNLRPAAAFTSEPVPYVIPDLTVQQNDDGEYEVRLHDDYLPNVYISRRYVQMLKDRSADPKAREYLKKKVQSAQWLLESIEQRRATLTKVAKAIIQHQRAFLDHGPEYVVPLKMQQIADQVGVHVTTVSRAVDGKWIQTPRGVFPLKRFFGGGTTTAEGEEVAWELIKQKLLDIIEHEDKANPLSDEELMEKLRQAGYPVARRTVTKYRKLLHIPSSRQRKDWTLSTTARATPETSGPAEPSPPAVAPSTPAVNEHTQEQPMPVEPVGEAKEEPMESAPAVTVSESVSAIAPIKDEVAPASVEPSAVSEQPSQDPTQPPVMTPPAPPPSPD